MSCEIEKRKDACFQPAVDENRCTDAPVHKIGDYNEAIELDNSGNYRSQRTGSCHKLHALTDI